MHIVLICEEEFTLAREINGSTKNMSRSIYQYSNMAPRRSDQTCKFLKKFYCLSVPKRLTSY